MLEGLAVLFEEKRCKERLGDPLLQIGNDGGGEEDSFYTFWDQNNSGTAVSDRSTQFAENIPYK